MKRKNLLTGMLILFGVSVIFTVSCKKDKDSITTQELSLAQDEIYVNALYEEIDNTISDELINLDKTAYTSLARKSTDVCVTITVDHPDSVSFPKIVTYDFSSGCPIIFNGDTLIYQGQIMVTITDRWFRTGAQQIISLNNFYINGIKIEGTKTITNLGINNKSHYRFQYELENGKVTFNDTLIITRQSDHIRELIRRLNPHNDTILVTGTASGINVLGQEYSREITEPLVMVHCSSFNWRWVIADGKIDLTNSETGSSTIEYNGGCTGEVIVSKNGNHNNYNFKFNKRFNRMNH